ncbi:MAG: hypothetical protein NVSMB9_22910 [Isosphaeraceae bacterium]
MYETQGIHLQTSPTPAGPEPRKGALQFRARAGYHGGQAPAPRPGLGGAEVVGHGVRSDHMSYSALRDVQRMASDYAEDLADQMELKSAEQTASMRCRDFEERLAATNGLLRLFLDLKHRYDSLDMRHELSVDLDAELRVEQAIAVLSRSCERIAARLVELEGQDFGVDGSAEFRLNRQKIEDLLGEAARLAKVEGRMGFRGVTMSDESADRFRTLMDSRSHSPAYEIPPSSHAK